MEAFFIYLLKSAILLSVITLIYQLCLRQTTFFVINRVYLLLGLFASLLLPLIRYSYDVVINIPNIPRISTTLVSIPDNSGSSVDIMTIVSIVYIAGMAIYLFKTLAVYNKIKHLIKTGTTERRNDCKIIINKDVESPFSILNHILINTDNLSDTEREAILKHEITHIKQRHWIDLLCSECMLLLQWFNPIMWFYISLQKENHEFLADKAVVNSGLSPALYKAVLLNSQFKGTAFSFANSFNHSNKSKRLIMVTKAKSSAWKKALILVLIPVFAIHLWVTAKPNYIIVQQPLGQAPAQETDTLSAQKAIYFSARDSVIMDINMKKITLYNEAVVKDQDLELTADVIEFNMAPEVPEVIDIDLQEIVIDKPIEPNSIDMLAYVPEVVQSNPTKPDSIIVVGYGRQRPAQSDEVVVVGYGRQRITKPDSIVAAYGRQDPRIEIRHGASGKPLFIVNGKEVESVDNINPEDVESISVLKDGSATSIYGEKAKNGVVIFELKNKVKNGITVDEALLDEVVAGYNTQRKATLTGTISSMANEDITVTKNEDVVNILAGKVPGVRISQQSSQPGEFNTRIDIRGMDDPLIVVDGIPRDQAYFSRMDANEIESISVLKDASAAIYGDKGKNGVVIIELKNPGK